MKCLLYTKMISLEVQLSTLHANYSIKNETGIHSIIEVIKNMPAAEISLFSEVVKVVCIVLVAPATNSISEQPFSVMCQIKTYLRSTLTQERPNAVMIMNVHHHLIDTLDLKSIANDFRLKNEHQKKLISHILICVELQNDSFLL